MPTAPNPNARARPDSVLSGKRERWLALRTATHSTIAAPQKMGIVAAIGAFWVEAVATAIVAQPQRPRAAAASARLSSDTVKISTWARARNQTSGDPMTSSAGTDPNVRAITQSAAPSSNAFVIVNAVSGWAPETSRCQRQRFPNVRARKGKRG